MQHYRPIAEESAFILFDVLQADVALQALGDFAEVDQPLMRQVLQESARFAGDRVAPLNRGGDETGCVFSAGSVTTPAGFRAAYQAFVAAGWPTLSHAASEGGQGLPWVLEGITYEWLSGANHAWTMAPGLLHGAYECLKHHGSDALKAAYLPRIASGEWLATMCLTEAHAGSDLGLVRTRAMPCEDPGQPHDAQPGINTRFAITGAKIFISGGEHDLTDNIIHLVLARLPDAPPGPKGLSLFLCPKLLPDGSRNGLACDRIEEKMGLHGSPTCSMRFDEATGWLVGLPNQGLAAMFIMMNAARLHVALQGVGLLDAAWQKAQAYAQERRQMRAPGPRDAASGADPIIRHPAMQRVLATQRAWIDGARLLCYRTGIELDLARHHPDAARRRQAASWCSLVTPILKSACTEQAFEGASQCLQVFGGHGYIREWGIEQIVRDARVSMIYEGTNEIQAIDLLIRKVLPDGGAAMTELLNALLASLRASLADEGEPGQAQVSANSAARSAINALQSATQEVCTAHAAGTQAAWWVAGDYLRMAAIALLAYAWAEIVGKASASPDPQRCSQAAQAFDEWVLPELQMRHAMIRRRCVQANVGEGLAPSPT
jgi:alkylation response protein AidB-like acyl-CoA dehydrogenase